MTMSYDEWLSTFRPILNQFDDNASYDGRMFETYGDEVTYVKDQPNPHIWTLLDAEGYTIISKGWHFVNRLGYFVCEVPFTDEDPDEIILSEPRYQAKAISRSEFQVIDTFDEVEMCIVNPYEGEVMSADERANIIADALNCHEV